MIVGILDPTGGESAVGVGPVAIGAILIRRDKANLDHGALHGRSRAEAGKTLRPGPPPEGAERIVVVWVAVKEGGFHGIACSEIHVAGSAVHRDTASQSNALSAAARGEFDVSCLSGPQRAVLRGFLHSCEPVLWDAAPALFKAALRGPA